MSNGSYYTIARQTTYAALNNYTTDKIILKIDSLLLLKYLHKMNRLEYYNRQSENWSEKEVQNIRSEYETKEMTISQIADIHHRTPGSISFKLKIIGLITHNTLSRGYLDYKNSDLYKEIVERGKSSDAENKLKKKDLPVSSPFRHIIHMRNEIADLKKDVKEILRLMNALYDFESQ
jgi:hypothetical protein